MVAKKRQLKPVFVIMLAHKYERDGDRQTLTMPFKLDSRANFRGHTRSHKHVKTIREQRNTTRMALDSQAERIALPVKLTLVRVAPRQLDAHENLPMCFKSIVDGIADWLGVDDRKGIACKYDQEKHSTPHTYGCRIIIEPGS